MKFNVPAWKAGLLKHRMVLQLALDTEITDELLREGITREFMNRVQNMRKEADYEVTDRIKIGYDGSELLDSAIKERLDTHKN